MLFNGIARIVIVSSDQITKICDFHLPGSVRVKIINLATPRAFTDISMHMGSTAVDSNGTDKIL